MCVVDGRLDINVALNRPSYLSTTFTGPTYGPYSASHGNDGDKNNCNAYSNTNSLAATHVELLNPWFGVDLGVALYVAGVRFTNRADSWGKWRLDLGTDHNCNKACNKTYDKTQNLKIIAQLLHNICSPH